MNILLISQCDKRALSETRRIIDQFAERRGERTWQTPITQAGLEALRKLLRKTARRNTAVACHWIRGRDHSELLWIVGDASRFNEQGAVPTNTTRRNILRGEDENDWHTLEDIRLLTQMAALLHDLGKASVAFQLRLEGELKEKNQYRHEWLSLYLFRSFVGSDNDEQWLQRLITPTANDHQRWLSRLQLSEQDKASDQPFQHLPPLAKAIAWLIVSHHRLPVWPQYDAHEKRTRWPMGNQFSLDPHELDHLLSRIDSRWNELPPTNTDPENRLLYWQIEGKLPVILPKWQAQASKLAKRLKERLSRSPHRDWLNNPYVMHLSRLTLMLADHHYSALEDKSKRVTGDVACHLFANTDRKGQLKQTLDEHLLGVARHAAQITHGLPGFERYLPRLGRHKTLRKRTDNPRFTWQNKAFDVASSLREQSDRQGAFIINMASTGCGKTLGNARVLYALSDPQQGMRATFALGLRTLTQQTGRSYRNDLHLDDDELAVRVGGSASRALFRHYQELAAATGSESQQALMEEDGHVYYDGQFADHPLLAPVMDDPRIARLLSAPLLVCTVDHLTPATEAQRAGRQIAPMLRLMSSDLVLDELDDFDLADLPALTRLVYWAGLLGSRVLLSSATLPPALVEGMFLAYHAGRQHYQQNRGDHSGTSVPCLWIDEFASETTSCHDADSLRTAHAVFVQQRIKALSREPARRCGELVPLNIARNLPESDRYEQFAERLRDNAILAHQRHHEICPRTGKQVSFGLIRMANIGPLFEVAQHLLRLGAPEHHRIHLCVYHSRFPLLLRSAIEHQLDTTLNRRQPEAVYERSDIRQLLDQHDEPDQVFIVLASPVAEVGRDHDYDWAIVEPSSMRSLIQLAGRIQRHRNKECTLPNVLILNHNMRHLAGGNGPAFIQPGFESHDAKVGANTPFRLLTHNLQKLLRPAEYQSITATPRIHCPTDGALDTQNKLVDLEHARLMQLMLPVKIETPAATGRRARAMQQPAMNAASFWQYPQASLTWAVPQQQPFRQQLQQEETLFLEPDEDEQQLNFIRLHEEGKGGKPNIYTDENNRVIRLTLNPGDRIQPWGRHDLMRLLQEQAEAQHLSLREAALRFTSVNVSQSTNGWRYHPVLGFGRKK